MKIHDQKLLVQNISSRQNWLFFQQQIPTNIASLCSFPKNQSIQRLVLFETISKVTKLKSPKFAFPSIQKLFDNFDERNNSRNDNVPITQILKKVPEILTH